MRGNKKKLERREGLHQVKLKVCRKCKIGRHVDKRLRSLLRKQRTEVAGEKQKPEKPLKGKFCKDNLPPNFALQWDRCRLLPVALLKKIQTELEGIWL